MDNYACLKCGHIHEENIRICPECGVVRSIEIKDITVKK